MRNRSNWVFRASLFVLTSLVGLAFTPIATVTSDEPFCVDGRAVTVSGITSIPLTVGHEVSTAKAPAVLFFADGSSVKLAASSRAKLVGSEAQPKLVLLAGSLDYKIVLGSNLSVTSLDLERTSKVLGRAIEQQAQAKRVSPPEPRDATLSVVTH